MAIRIQLRRDTAANWTSSNPVLRAGELGIETDTLKFKIGNGSSTWTQITSYANITPTGLSNSLGSYILSADQGNAGGPAELDANGDLIVPQNSVILWNDDAHTYSTTLTATQPTADRTITFPNATGTVALAENVAALSGATFTGNISVPSQITFEGTTANDFETIIAVTDPTSDRVIVFPDLTGTVVTSGDTGTVTNLMLAGSIANDKLSNSAITINGTSTSLGGTRTLGTDDITEGTTNKYFTDERAQDAVSTALAAGTHTNLTVTYNDEANSISLAAAPGYVDEQAVDAVATALAAGTHTNISVSYNDAGNAISLTGAVTYTDENAQDAIGNAVGTGLSYNDTTGAISVDTTAIQAKVANVDDTEIGYLNGVTSGIQTQIDNKASLSGATFTGAVSGTSLTLSGDLTVNGTTTTLNSTTISIDDKNIELGSVATPSDATADGGGITLKGATDKTFNWVDATDAWTSSEHLNLASGKSLYLNGTLLKDATETLTNKTLTSPVINTPTGITKSDVGLANVDNTTDAGKPVSTATQTALDLKLASATAATTYETITNVALKAPIASPTFTGTVAGITSTMVGLGNVDNTSDANKPVSTATQTALDLKVDESLFDAKGDLLVASADNTPAKLSVGTNGYLLTANSSATNGVEWAAAPVSLPSQTGNSGEYLTTDGTTASWAAIPVTSAATRTTLGTVLGYTDVSSTNYNVAIGPNAGPITPSSSNVSNVSIGNYANGSITSGNSNTAIGTSSFSQNSAGIGNTGVGGWAGYDNTSGSYNVFLGHYAGTGNSSGSNNILIGNQASASSSSVSNEITLGNSSITRFRIPGIGLDFGKTSTISSNTATTIDSIELTSFTSAEYLLSLKQGSKVRTSKVIVQDDGTNVDMTEFAITETGGTMSGVVVSAAASSGNAVLQLTVTDAASTNVTVKLSKVVL